ncbi:hypothetical protein H257_04961 [Aphanomyces astaci]|uniref:Uncharacterized protein n=2 Tax=Aphanomyces astaci TaxID=112090 RepID=W4GRD6_APHAT|nr:hypothetical protein H257_04961 [Aphanomyces astaci]ETV82262.1 hypothetical protein H257_04961 [Aphanomyces astaci]|eukprot:XP_009827931.1 hypothetical protein H257_04961 [Aphanomyces astaci]
MHTASITSTHPPSSSSMASSPLPSGFHQRSLLSSPTTSVPSMDDSSSADETFPSFNQMLRSSSSSTTVKKSFKMRKDDSESSREIRREYKKEWYEKNREKALAKMKEYYERRKQAGTLHRRSIKQKKVTPMPPQQSTMAMAPVVTSLPSMAQIQHRNASMGLMPSRYVYEERCIPTQRTIPSPWGYDRALPSLSEQPTRRSFLHPNHHHAAVPAPPTGTVAHLNLLCDVALMN